MVEASLSTRQVRVAKLLLLLVFVVVGWGVAPAQEPCEQEVSQLNPAQMQCPPGIPLDRSIFNPTPLIDGGGYNGHRLRYPDPDTGPEIVSLYGHHGQNEQAIGDTLAQAHYNAGITEASQIVPRCPDGSTTNCAASDLRIVFLFIGFSNCDIEVCGSKSDIWADPASGFKGIAGQGCATTCNNLHNPEGYPAWNNTSNPDDGPTESLLYQIYAENKLQQRPQVVFFDGAFGGQTLDKWDPTALGFYADPDHPCPFGSPAKVHDPECNYSRVKALLEHNGFTENQVQAIFLKSSTSFPQCDIQGEMQNPNNPGHCTTGYTVSDAHVSEQYLGNIMRYLKQGLPPCGVGPCSRYPNLHQVFVTSRIYGGYAQNTTGTHGGSTAGCLSPEPYAYEEAFGVQRLIVAQIDGTADTYSGNVSYPNDAPWFDWGPYLWANGDTGRSDGLRWCDTTSNFTCAGKLDFRYGQTGGADDYLWGDHTHPSAQGAGRVSGLILDFLGRTPHQRNAFVPWLDAP